MKTLLLLFFALLVSVAISCKDAVVETNTMISSETSEDAIKAKAQNVADCISVMETHLNAVSNRDLKGLRKTLSPSGNMLLILPQTETMTTVDAFMDYHTEWFAMPNWTFETTIVDQEIGQELAYVIVQSMYREPERNGQPYFNRMTISYDLKKVDGSWYVVKDHATSVEKSTDLQS